MAVERKRKGEKIHNHFIIYLIRVQYPNTQQRASDDNCLLS